MRESEFELACRTARSLPDVDPDVLLQLYGLYKQAVFGDAVGARPGILDLRAQAKFDAWAAHRGMSRDEAMTRYVDQVAGLVGTDAAAKNSADN
jgi:carboxylesterase